MSKKKELGLGIRALLGDIAVEGALPDTQKELLHTVCDVPVEQIEVNPFQPRVEFDAEKLTELADSIRIHGIIQPVTVRVLAPNQYQLISGERRLRASKIAGLERIPAYVRLADDQTLLEMALIENIQRQDLNAIEIAQSYQRLIDECSLTHDDMAKRVGKNRSTVTNFLRLLKLPPEIQIALKTQKISAGHARALAGIDAIDKQLAVFKTVLEKDLTVRQTEEISKNVNAPSNLDAQKAPKTSNLSIHYRKIQEELSSHFGAKVSLRRSERGKGELSIPFDSDAELNHILSLINSYE